MQEYKHYLNGKYVNENELLISPRDLGFSRSFGVFDYLKTYNEKPFKLKEHIERLLNSAKLINLKHEYSLEGLINIVEETLHLNKDGNEKTIKIILTGGVSNYMYPTSGTTLIVIIDLLKLKNEEVYEKGIKINSVKFERYLPESKTTNYIEGVKQTQIGMESGAYEPLYYTDEQVCEGSNSNVFVVKNKKLFTPKNGILFGITRNTIIDELKDSFEIVEENFTLDFLLNADEVFFTSSGKEIVPVVKVDDFIIGTGNVGQICKLVLEKFRNFANTIS